MPDPPGLLAPELNTVTAATLRDLIFVSLSWDIFRFTVLVPQAANSRAAAAILLVKVLLVELIPFLLLRRGKTALAAWILASSAMLISGTYIVLSGALHSSAISLEVGMVCVAVILLGARGAAIFASACFAFIASLVFADLRHLLPPVLFPESNLTVLTNILTSVTLAAIPAARAVGRLRQLSLNHAIALSRLDTEHQELKSSQEELEAERAHLRTILDSEPECIKLVSPSGKLLDMNPAGLAMVEVDSLDLVRGCQVSDLIDAEFRQAFDDLHARACQGHSGTMQYSLTGRRGGRLWLETHVAPLRHSGGRIVAAVAVTRDITAQKLSESDLRESEGRFRVLFDYAPFGAILLDPETLRILDANHLAQAHLGYSRDEFLQLSILDIDAALNTPDIHHFGQSATAQSPAEFETRHRAKNGRVTDSFVYALPLQIHGRTVIYSAFQDITERKLLESQRTQLTARLRELAGHLELAREAERKHLAREIHDQLGQQLTALKMQVDACIRNHPVPEVRDQQGEIQEQIEAAIRSVRSIATELRPGVLDSLGLIPALEWLAQDFEKKHGIPCAIHMDEFACDETSSTVLFRIAQEALTNIARHASATSVTITLSHADSTSFLEILDNGTGIQPSDLNKSGHFGLVGMRERALLAGGTLSISPTSPSGTSLRVALPVNAPTVTAPYATTPR